MHHISFDIWCIDIILGRRLKAKGWRRRWEISFELDEINWRSCFCIIEQGTMNFTLHTLAFLIKLETNLKTYTYFKTLRRFLWKLNPQWRTFQLFLTKNVNFQVLILPIRHQFQRRIPKYVKISIFKFVWQIIWKLIEKWYEFWVVWPPLWRHK